MCKDIQGAGFSLLPDVKRFRQLREHGPDEERRLAGDDVLDVERRALAVPVGEGSYSLDFVLRSSARLILGANARAP